MWVPAVPRAARRAPVIVLAIAACGPKPEGSADEGAGSSSSTTTSTSTDLSTADATTEGGTVVDDGTGGSTTASVPACGDGVVTPGELCFSPSMIAGVSPRPLSIAAGDLDADGWPDLAIGYQGAQITILWNRGGTLMEGTDSLQTLGSTRKMALRDVDGDGVVDVVATTTPPGTGYVEVWVGDGAGGLVAVDPVAIGGTPLDLDFADLDLDGTDELLVVSWNENLVRVLASAGGGVFAEIGSHTVGQRPRDIAVADLDDDGDDDLVAGLENCYGGWMDPMSYCDPGLVEVLLGDGVGGFAPPSAHDAAAWYTDAVLVADYDGDGAEDVVAVTFNCDYSGAEPSCDDPGQIGLFRGDGLGGLGVVEPIATGLQEARGGVAADFDGDGRPDIAIGRSDFSALPDVTGSIAILVADDNPDAFAEPFAIESGASLVGIATADFNGDGALDLASADITSQTITLVLSDP